MAYVNNPSIPAFPVSTQTEVKTAITNIANWIIAFNTKLGDTIGEYNGYGTANYSSSLLNFVQKAMTDDKVVYNTLQKLTSRITESHLTADLNTRINLIDDPNTGLVQQIIDTNTKLAQETIDRMNAINQEATTRADAIIDEIEARQQAILTEALNRTEAIDAETQARTVAIAQETTNRTIAIAQEAAIRMSADESEATTREGLAVTLTGYTDPTGKTIDDLSIGLIFEEKNARINSDEAEVATREELAVSLIGASEPGDLTLNTLSSGLLYDEKIARLSADSSEVTARQTLSTKVIGVPDPTGVTLATLASGLIYDEKTARSSADSAEATSRQSLSATLTGYSDPTGKTLADINTGIINEEKTARAAADGAMASDISTLSATTATNTANITAINTVSSSSTSTNAKILAGVKSTIEDPSTGLYTKASVTQLTNAITTLDTALSQDITQLSTTVDNNTSSIETLAQVTDGVQAEYTVKLNTNNKIAGFGLMLEEGEPSTFEILANRFAIVNTDGITSTVPFFVEDSNVYMNSAIIHEINADNIIANGTIKSPIIQGGQLSATSGTFTGELIAATGTFAGSLSAGVVDLSTSVGQNFSYPNAGNYTVYTMPYIGSVRFTIVGGGGGGAGGSRYNYAGDGGRAANITTATVHNVPIGTTISVTIGAGGIGGIEGASGGTGGTTTININGYTYSATGGIGGNPVQLVGESASGSLINRSNILYHTSDWGDFAVSATSAGNAASYSGSVGGARGAAIYGGHIGDRGATLSGLHGGAGVRGGGGGGGAPTNAYVFNRGFYQDPVDGSGGDGLPASNGGNGGAGFAFIEIWNPNGVVLYANYKTLVDWLNTTSIGPVPSGVL